MKTNGFFAVLAMVIFSGSLRAGSSLPADDIVLPIFESHSNVNFDGGTGVGWWNLTQYEDRATVSIGAYTTQRVIGVQKGMVVDKEDPSLFSFNISMRTLGGKAPSGKLNFSSYSSSGANSLNLQVNDGWQDVLMGWDQLGVPVYRQEMWANFHADLFADAVISSVNDSFGRWTAEWINEKGEVYFAQSGGEFYVSGWGRFAGENPLTIGRSMVAGGFATYGAVPEPATASLALAGAVMLLRRRRAHK